MKALDKLAPPASAKFPPVLASIDVEAGYERALAAALGDDLDASTHADAPARWAGAETPAPHLPPEAHSLARFVKAPAALAARLSLVGVVEASTAPALARKLTPGARLVSREGDLWRWDGFVRRADAPQPAAARLEQKNRLAAARSELATAPKSARAKPRPRGRPRRPNAKHSTPKARALRAEAPKHAAAAADAAREAERLEAERSRQDRAPRANWMRNCAATDVEIEEARAMVEQSGEAAAGADMAPPDETALDAARAAADAARLAAAEAAAAAAEPGARPRPARCAARTPSRRNPSSGAHASRMPTSAWQRSPLNWTTIERRRDAAKAAPVAARRKLDALMDEAGAAEARRAEASDRVS